MRTSPQTMMKDHAVLCFVLGMEGSGCARAALSALTGGAAARCSPQLQLGQKWEGRGRAVPAAAPHQFHPVRLSAGARELPGGSEEAWLWWQWRCFSSTLKSCCKLPSLCANGRTPPRYSSPGWKQARLQAGWAPACLHMAQALQLVPGLSVGSS